MCLVTLKELHGCAVTQKELKSAVTTELKYIFQQQKSTEKTKTNPKPMSTNQRQSQQLRSFNHNTAQQETTNAQEMTFGFQNMQPKIGRTGQGMELETQFNTRDRRYRNTVKKKPPSDH